MAPTTTKQWTIEGKDGFDSLEFDDKAEIPTLGERDVLVNFHYASLNYRDLIITKVFSPSTPFLSTVPKTASSSVPQGKYPFPIALPKIPASDGAGTIVATGSRVTRFQKGDAVLTLFNQSHLAGNITLGDLDTGLGGAVDGTLRQYGTFDENGLVKMPETLNFQQGSTLSCAALTAWNGLYGVEGKRLIPGDTVLTQGTGGVSIFALQVRMPQSLRLGPAHKHNHG